MKRNQNEKEKEEKDPKQNIQTKDRNKSVEKQKAAALIEHYYLFSQGEENASWSFLSFLTELI